MQPLSLQNQGDSTAGSGPSVDKYEEILDPQLEALNQAMCKIANLLGDTSDGAFLELDSPEDEPLKPGNLLTDKEFEDALQQAQDAIRHMEGLSKKTYHRLHLIVEYLSTHPNAKCQDIADHIQVGNERTRIHLVQLANANIVQIQGNARSRTYSLQNNL